MNHRNLAVIVSVLFVTALVIGSVRATPPPPGTEGNGLSENDSATLWSRDADSYLGQAQYRQRYDENRTAMHQVANGTDITFTRPPATAATWTRNDFKDLDAGGSATSVHPPSASLDDGVFIKDAHATVFAAQPSTRGHLESGDTPLYIAPNGSMYGLVDYRVRVPNSTEATSWVLVESEIESVQLRSDGELVAETNGTHTPTIEYQLGEIRSTELTLEAEINVRLQHITPDGVTYKNESRTVSDSIAVEVYDHVASPYYAEYPNGDAGIAIFQSRPWQGYILTADGNATVRGVWRFYTARNADWDTLVRSSRAESDTVESDAIPVYVHGYPSRIGPRAEPVRDGPTIIDTWGTNRSSPANTIGENVNIDIIDRPYTTTHGVAVRTETVDREALRVTGIVRSVNVSIAEPDAESKRQLRGSDLSIEIVQRNQSRATLRIELRDNRSGDPIVLDGSRQRPIGGAARSGYITVADRRVETNESGVAVVTLDEPGIYTARYQPGSWLGHDPAYVGDSATTRWHPLGTVDGWFAFAFEVVWQLFPFLVMFYAGKRLLRMFSPGEIFR
jgi:hypothetical protein